MASPPPSFSRSGWLGTAWQEEQPPALNVVMPLARFGVCGASEAGATTAGIVSHQKMPRRRRQPGSSQGEFVAAFAVRRQVREFIAITF
jgi:hypothetical protein